MIISVKFNLNLYGSLKKLQKTIDEVITMEEIHSKFFQYFCVHTHTHSLSLSLSLSLSEGLMNVSASSSWTHSISLIQPPFQFSYLSTLHPYRLIKSSHIKKGSDNNKMIIKISWAIFAICITTSIFLRHTNG